MVTTEVKRGKEGCLAHIGKKLKPEDWKALAEFFQQEAVARAEENDGLFDADEYGFAAIAAFRALGGEHQIPAAWVLFHMSGRGFPLPAPIEQKVNRLMAERKNAHELLPQVKHVERAANQLFKQMDVLKKAVKALGPDWDEEEGSVGV